MLTSLILIYFILFFFTFQFRLPFEFRSLKNRADNSESKHGATILTHNAGNSVFDEILLSIKRYLYNSFSLDDNKRLGI